MILESLLQKGIRIVKVILVSMHITTSITYDAVRYLRFVEENDRLEILALIQWHMFPYFWEKDNNTKMQSKYKKLWGDELYDKIMLLHKADMEAH